MALDLLGPANATGAVTVRPTDTRAFGSVDTWFKDCSSASVDDGTDIQAALLNALLAQLRHAIRGAGVTEDNADDDMLLKAIRKLAPGGNALLVKSGSNLVLQPYNGTQLIVNGNSVTIPTAGVALSTSGLAANTTYFIYAFMNAGTLTLEASTTGRAQHSDGTWIKSGNPTRALVGIARTNASTQWADTPSQRFVRSFFNRKSQPLTNRFTANRSTAAIETSKVELSTEIRCEFVCFDDDVMIATSAGYFFNSAAAFTYCSVAYDGTNTDTGTISAAFGTGGSVLNAARTAEGLADGYHYATLVGYVSGGTGTWGGGAANTPTCAIHAILV